MSWGETNIDAEKIHPFADSSSVIQGRKDVNDRKKKRGRRQKKWKCALCNEKSFPHHPHMHMSEVQNVMFHGVKKKKKEGTENKAWGLGFDFCFGFFLLFGWFAGGGGLVVGVLGRKPITSQ